MSILKLLENLSLNAIEILFVFSYVILGSFMIGLTLFSPKTYDTVQLVLQLLISLFIVYKFNPFTRRTSITDMERRVIFSCGIYLLLTVIPFDTMSL